MSIEEADQITKIFDDQWSKDRRRNFIDRMEHKLHSKERKGRSNR